MCTRELLGGITLAHRVVDRGIPHRPADSASTIETRIIDLRNTGGASPRRRRRLVAVANGVRMPWKMVVARVALMKLTWVPTWDIFNDSPRRWVSIEATPGLCHMDAFTWLAATPGHFGAQSAKAQRSLFVQVPGANGTVKALSRNERERPPRERERPPSERQRHLQREGDSQPRRWSWCRSKFWYLTPITVHRASDGAVA